MTGPAATLASPVSILSACAVGPNYVPPEDPPVRRYTREPLKNPSAADAVRARQGGSAEQSFASGADIPRSWWTLFHAKALNRLVEPALAQQRNLLTALAGRLPSDEISATFELSAPRLPTKLPVSLPSRLVQQRPDVKAAEAPVQQASARATQYADTAALFVPLRGWWNRADVAPRSPRRIR